MGNTMRNFRTLQKGKVLVKTQQRMLSPWISRTTEWTVTPVRNSANFSRNSAPFNFGTTKHLRESTWTLNPYNRQLKNELTPRNLPIKSEHRAAKTCVVIGFG